MEVSLWMYITVYIAQLIGVSLALAVFPSLYFKSRKNGILLLVIIIIAILYSLIQGFSASAAMGTGMLIISICLLAAAYINVQRQKEKNYTH
ncbi:hypothetical protein F9U64_10625 [Gracilibacillus oryzae]|uniref:YesK-like protein n=1 Tax=Gracilibacillus oryzae TaxID=1672701 RepID=A0A7C8GU42_9BACI|nr:hypothetical protein [Gracilibacillus oryzae]KAB8135724.1 hypothetical protein F9U64_10625 [Gracilibacillus oryzae]